MIPPRPRDPVELTTRDVVVCLAPPGGFGPDVVVGVATHAARHDLARCLASIAAQQLAPGRVGVVVLLDTPGSELYSPALPDDLRCRTWLLRANCGSPARARNAILEFVEGHIPSCRWVARLDWDDRFADPASLPAAVAAGDAEGSRFVLGGNRVLDRSGTTLRVNAGGAWLRDKDAVVSRLRAMADGTAENELPSCNLLLAARAGVRYPDTPSAEDHWLVADLLLNHAYDGAVLESTLFADYTVDGSFTADAKRTERYRAARVALHRAAQTWTAVATLPGRILGLGQEGIVREHDGTVFKHFYPSILTSEKVQWLERALAAGQTIAPTATFRRCGASEQWTATYPSQATTPFDTPSAAAVSGFLADSLRSKLVCGNIKRSNFRVREDGRLLYIDIGNWIVPMDVSVLRDSAARLYSIGVLGASDEEVLRRPADHARPEIWERLPGFAGYYADVVGSHIRGHWSSVPVPSLAPVSRRRADVTLLIKACAMDAGYAREQINHLVDQLVGPADFAERLLVIDAHAGPFLRPHTAGSLDKLRDAASDLLHRGVLDRVLLAPTDAQQVARLNREWFGLDSSTTHSSEGVPVAPQLWAFEQVSTRYVLQCDIDTLVGRRDRSHDYLADMTRACAATDVVGVAFNIPHDPRSPPRPYDAPPGGHKPEVRCGLLDLVRLRALRPLPNTLMSGRVAQPWYRALHEAQRRTAMRTLRGGHPSTFYIHPTNAMKTDAGAVARVRDLVAQGLVPRSHWGRWDVGPDMADWTYPHRAEPVVVLGRGRNTPRPKIERFAAGLAMQDEQSFGVIAIDDASDDGAPVHLTECLAPLGSRLTLVRHGARMGRMRNMVLAVRGLCDNPRSLVVVVDLDDALADPAAIRAVGSLRERGHDLVLAAPFRPDVPTKVYRPDFVNPRGTVGGDVWIHLRAFDKRLFDQLPDSALQLDGRWIEECDDYATMVPLAELAMNPVYVPEFWYWHERTTGHDPVERARRDETIRRLLAKPSMVSRRE